jgi:hypothetical protein
MLQITERIQEIYSLKVCFSFWCALLRLCNTSAQSVSASEMCVTRRLNRNSGAEHEAISLGVFIKDHTGKQHPAKDYVLWKIDAAIPWTGPGGSINPFAPKRKEITVRFGRVLALAGDYYSSALDDKRTPICGAFFTSEPTGKPAEDFSAQKKRFKSAVDSFVTDKDGNLVGLTTLLDEETSAVAEAEKLEQAHDAKIHTIANAYHLHACGIPTSSKWAFATRGGKNPQLSLFAYLCYINADHFVT